MSLDSEEIITIYNETVLGKPLSIDTPEAKAFQEKIMPEIKQAIDDGKVLHIPHELRLRDKEPERSIAEMDWTDYLK